MSEPPGRLMVIIRIVCVVVAVALLAFLALEAAHWPEDQQSAWDTGGPWFVMAWVLAVLTVIATMITFLTPALAWTSATFGSIGICMIVVAAARTTTLAASATYVPLLYAGAETLLVLAASIDRMVRGGPRSRTRVLAATWILLACSIVVFVIWKHRRPPAPIGFVVEMEAVDDGAVLVWWMGSEDHSGSRGWVTRVDLQGRTVWRSAMPDEALTGDSIAIGDGIVTVRYTHRTSSAQFGADHAVVAFSLANGRLLWDQTLAVLDRPEGEHVEASLNPSANAVFVGDRLVEWAQQRHYGDLALILDPKTGAIRSQLPWRDMDQTFAVGKTRVVQHDLDEVVALDLESGTATQQKTRGTGCVIGNEYVTIDGDLREEPSLVAFANGDLSERRVIKAPFAVAPGGGYFRLRRCGHYRDRIVLVISRFGSEDYTPDTLVLITAPTGEVLHEITLPSDGDWDGEEAVANRYYEHASLAGELSRFAPYVYEKKMRDHDPEFRIAMLDLEEGKVAWQSDADGGLLRASLFREANQWYLVSGFYRDVLTVFDGETGRLTHAAVAHAYEGTLSVKPPYVRNGRLWTASGEHEPIDHAPVAVFDARTLQPIFASRTIEVRDVTTQRQHELGLDK